MGSISVSFVLLERERETERGLFIVTDTVRLQSFVIVCVCVCVCVILPLLFVSYLTATRRVAGCMRGKEPDRSKPQQMNGV